MNKKIVTLLIISLVLPGAFLANAQKDSAKTVDKKEMKTLINTNLKLKSWGISVSPYAQFGQPGRQTGLSALFHLNNTWAIGVTGMSSVRKGDRYNFDATPEQRFGGLHIEYTPKSNSLLHVSFPLIVGMVAQEKPMDWTTYDPLLQPIPQTGGTPYPTHLDRMAGRWDNLDKSFGIQPGVNLEVNLFKYAKIFGGVNYRFAFGRNSNADIQGVSGQFGFKFGVFNKKVK